MLEILKGILTGAAGGRIGNVVSEVAQLAAVIAALAPIAIWLAANKDGIFIVLTYGDLAFWGVIFGGFALLVIRLVHRAPPP